MKTYFKKSRHHQAVMQKLALLRAKADCSTCIDHGVVYEYGNMELCPSCLGSSRQKEGA